MVNRPPQTKKQPITIAKFGGINTKTSLKSIGDNEFGLLLNLMPIDDGNLSTIPANNEITPTTPTTARRMTNIILDGCVHTFIFDGQHLYDGSTLVGNFTNPRLTVWNGVEVLIIDPLGYFTYSSGTLSTPQIFGSVEGNIAIYNNRVWLSQGKTVIFSAAGSYTDFDPAGGAGVFTLNDSNLRTRITGFCVNDNILYIFGDHSIYAVSSIQIVGTETVPQLINTGSVIGTSAQELIINFNNFVIFANDLGIFTVKGIEVQKISDNLNGIWKFLSPLTASQATINGLPVYLLYSAIITPFNPLITTTYIILAFYNGKWFMLSSIEGQITYSQSDMPVYQFNGGLNELFTGNGVMPSTLETKLYGFQYEEFFKKLYSGGLAFKTPDINCAITLNAVSEEKTSIDYDFTSPTGQINFVNSTGGLLQFQNSTAGNLDFLVSAQENVIRKYMEMFGYYLGFSLKSTNKYTLERMFMEIAPIQTNHNLGD